MEGVFDAFWDGPTLRALNSVVDGDYVLAEAAGPPVDSEPWARGFTIGHLNYHPDGGQSFSAGSRRLRGSAGPARR